MLWKLLLSCVKGDREEAIYEMMEYVLEENRTYRKRFGRIQLVDAERIRLAEKAIKLTPEARAELATIVTPETLLRWHRKLVAKKFTSDPKNRKPGRPRKSAELEQEVLRRAEQNPGWGYDRIADSLRNNGFSVSDQTVGNILERNGIQRGPERKRNTTWAQFIRRHMHVMWACDFFTTEVWTPSGLVTMYVLFFIHHASRKVVLGGITPNPNDEWMKAKARYATEYDGFLKDAKYLIHDRDPKLTHGFDDVIRTSQVKPIILPAQSPNLNAYAERFVRSIKEECLDQMILFGERQLRYCIKEYLEHYHAERNHQGLDDHPILFPDGRLAQTEGDIVRSKRLGGLLNFYHREAEAEAEAA